MRDYPLHVFCFVSLLGAPLTDALLGGDVQALQCGRHWYLHSNTTFDRRGVTH